MSGGDILLLENLRFYNEEKVVILALLKNCQNMAIYL